MSPVKVAIATGGRFHVLDLARELDALKQAVTFYSFLPVSRGERFGLPAQCQVSVLPAMVPSLALQRLAPRRWRDAAARLSVRTLDRVVAKRLRSCDVLIAMSGLFLETLRRAKDRFGATVILERGNRHILSQDKILREMNGGRGGVDPFTVERELAGYELVDYISVPSQHVVESFLAQGIPAAKLLVNPYGCDLAMFPPTARNGPDEPTILFVGTWSRRKGCDVLLQAWRSLNRVGLLHVGPVGDLPLPEDPGFRHVDAVPQQRLSRFYAQADVFVLASREEGLALVQAQALASGLPVVCTTRTGGRDLRDLLGLREAVTEVEPDDAPALASAIQGALVRAGAPRGEPRQWPHGDLERMSWAAYGRRYLANLEQIGQPQQAATKDRAL